MSHKIHSSYILAPLWTSVNTNLWLSRPMYKAFKQNLPYGNCRSIHQSGKTILGPHDLNSDWKFHLQGKTDLGENLHTPVDNPSWPMWGARSWSLVRKKFFLKRIKRTPSREMDFRVWLNIQNSLCVCVCPNFKRSKAAPRHKIVDYRDQIKYLGNNNRTKTPCPKSSFFLS